MSVIDILCSQKWLMEQAALEKLLADVEAIPEAALADAVMQFGDESEDGGAQPYKVVDGVAHIQIVGPIMRNVPKFFSWFGISATSTVSTEAALAMALDDGAVKSIMLDVDSPGGTAPGVGDLADTIRDARKVKPVVAHNNNIMASAAYWIGSQASTVSAAKYSSTGSIGAYVAIRDSSKMHAENGVKVHVVASHDLKGIGVRGAKVTDAHLAELQRGVDEITEVFVNGIAEGRKLDAAVIQESATGQVWRVDDAKERKLIDHVESAADAHLRAVKMGDKKSRSAGSSVSGNFKLAESTAAKGETTMAEEATTEGTDELEALRTKLAAVEGKNAQLEAKADVQAAAVEESKQNAVDVFLASSKDRVTPALAASVKAYAASVGNDLAEVKTFVASLPVQTRVDPVGDTPEGENVQEESAELSAEDAKAADLFGLAHKTMKAGANIASASILTGVAYDAEGNEIDLTGAE